MNEWRPIISLESQYEASSDGQVRRCVAARGTRVGRLLTTRSHKGGYRTVAVQIEGRTSLRLVHRLVADAFLGPCEDGIEVNHKDSNKENNAVDNLEYVTRSQNLRHATNATGAYRGTRNSQAIINEATVHEIRRLHADGMGYKRLAKHFGLSWGLVRSVANRQNWSHI